ncbi:DcaP family trimeric outer membrane transporter [Halomonas elongata]|uniref:DcaP family trimeric outer membrane transporter n=1 Tax=Halomonas elongata TaxID=2746 RepID=UPI0023AFC458|nr:DcaP family trimeric outer membrane transporter [Halomonas elongata]
MNSTMKRKAAPAFILSFGIGITHLLAGSQYAIAQDSDSEIEELKEQMRALQLQIEEMKKNQTEADKPRKMEADNVVTGGDIPGSFKLPGSNTSVKIGGYIKFDAIYDLNQDLGDTLFVDGLDVSNEDSNSSFRAHARQSRLYLKTSTPTSLGNATTYIEGDFFGGGGNEVFSNSSGFRLRHAYGELAGLLAGQTWSNFMHFAAYPTTVDFDGPVGVSFIRQGQLRYTLPAGPGELSLSAENPEGTGFEDARDTSPDVTARYHWNGENTEVETAAVVRRLKTDSPAASSDDSTFGYGLMLAGNVDVTDSTRLMAGVMYGDGIGRYIYTANGVEDGEDSIGAAYINAGGELETIEAYGFNVAVTQQWTDKFSSGLSFGQVRGDRPADLFPTSTRTLQSIHFSNFYQWSEPVTLGFEISNGFKELQNRDSENNTRLQLSAKYTF